MNKRFLLVLLIILPFVSFSQYLWDIGGSIGASSFLGDVGGKNTPAKKFIGDLNMPSTRPGLGLYARYKISPLFSVRAMFSYSSIAGDDKLSTYLPRKGRNLSFRNNIYELSVSGEVYFYEIPGLVQNFKTNVDFKSYVSIGVSGFHHNPQAQYQGQWVDLAPLHTEGVNYSLWQVAVPIGLGANFTVNRKHRIGLEVIWRKTFTDYLDDVSTRYVDPSTLSSPTAVALANRSGEIQTTDPDLKTLLSYNYQPHGLRGDPKNNDTWFTYQLTYSYVIRGKSSFYRSRYPTLFGKKNRKRKIRAKF